MRPARASSKRGRTPSNQLRKPHRLGKRKLPGWMTPLFMVALIVAEVGGVAVLGIGALQTIWS